MRITHSNRVERDFLSKLLCHFKCQGTMNEFSVIGSEIIKLTSHEIFIHYRFIPFSLKPDVYREKEKLVLEISNYIYTRVIYLTLINYSQ